MGKENMRWESQKKVLRYLKQSNFEKKSVISYLCFFFLACPLLWGNFYRDNRNGTWAFCLLMRGVRYFCPLFRGFFIRDLYIFFPVFEVFSVIWRLPLFGMSANQRFYCTDQVFSASVSQNYFKRHQNQHF